MSGALYRLYRDLPRVGPGTAADVLWALEATGTPARARILDAGCGPGADTVTLAEARPEARIEAMDRATHLVAEAAGHCAGFGDRVRVRQGDMAAPGGPYDLIWSAGAVYFLGVTEALTGWRKALAPGGKVAFSEPVWMSETPSVATREFWAEYPAITGFDGIAERVRAAGFQVIGSRIIKGADWAGYYEPLAARIAVLRPGTDAELAAVLDESSTEIALWRKAQVEIAYALILAEPA